MLYALDRTLLHSAKNAELQDQIGDIVIWENCDPFQHGAMATAGQFHSGGIASEQIGKIAVDMQGRLPLCMYVNDPGTSKAF